MKLGTASFKKKKKKKKKEKKSSVEKDMQSSEGNCCWSHALSQTGGDKNSNQQDLFSIMRMSTYLAFTKHREFYEHYFSFSQTFKAHALSFGGKGSSQRLQCGPALMG